jgi:hypothetical protein
MHVNNIVIGLPDIIEKFFYLFSESLQLCREEIEDSKHYLQSIVLDRCLPKIISLYDYPMNHDNLLSVLSELASGQTDTTPFPDIYDLNEQELFTPWVIISKNHAPKMRIHQYHVVLLVH